MPNWRDVRIPRDTDGNLVANIVPRVNTLSNLQSLADGNGELMSANDYPAIVQQSSVGGSPRTYVYKPTLVAGTVSLLAQSGVAIVAPNDTNENVLVTIAVPAGYMGANGALRVSGIVDFTSGSGLHTFRVRFSGAAGTVYLTPGASAATKFPFEVTIANRGSVSSQIGSSNPATTTSQGLGFMAGSTAVPTSSVDTDQATSVVLTAQKATAGDGFNLEAYRVELLRIDP